MAHSSHLGVEVGMYKNMWIDQSDKIKEWYNDGQTKIILSTTSLEKYTKQANDNNIKVFIVPDLGFYEVEKGEILMIGISPVTEDEAENVGLRN